MTLSLKNLGKFFWIVNPSDYVNKTLDEAHQTNVIIESQYWYIFFFLTESLHLHANGKLHPNTSLVNWLNVMLYGIGDLLFKSFFFGIYVNIWNNYGMNIFPSNVFLSWIIGMLILDLIYYWSHRGAHEIAFFWAVHQTHHGSEDYNITVGGRNNVLSTIVFPLGLPFALVIPPAQMLLSSTLLKQSLLWNHTVFVESLGPLDYIFNSPKHHKLHHASNREYLDKNYGGFLIIWDRIFGTYAEADPKIETVYGLVDQPQTMNPLYLQFFYWKCLWQKASSMETWRDWASTWVKGPGWMPGTPRLGDYSTLPDVRSIRST